MQKPNEDYTTTYSPVVRYSTLRFLFALASRYKFMMFHLDVETAFLNGEIDEEIYVYQPAPFVNQKAKEKVLKLHKALYGLKQSSHKWNQKLIEILNSLNFKQLQSDNCVFTNEVENQQLIKASYVDDLIILTNSLSLKNKLIHQLREHVTIRDLGELKFFLNINIDYNKNAGDIAISQTNYIIEILKRFDMETCNNLNTPLEPSLKLTKAKTKEAVTKSRFQYQEAVGCILYLSQTTRPDLAFAATTLSRFNSCYNKHHVKAVRHVLKYLQGTKDLKLTLTDQVKTLVRYSDSNLADGIKDKKSTAGYIFFLYGFPVSWSSKRQSCVSGSTCQAEYLAMSRASKEAITLRNLAIELDYIINQQPTKIYGDNKPAVDYSNDQNSGKNLRHIALKYHEIKDFIKKRLIITIQISTDQMIADIFTKALPGPKHEFCVSSMGLRK